MNKLVTVLGLVLAATALAVLRGNAVPSDSTTVPVRVANTTASPVPTLDVDALAQGNFQQSLCFEVGSVHSAFCPPGSTNSILVPGSVNGKPVTQLILEYVSAHCFVSPGDQLVDLSLVNSQTNGYVIHYFGPAIAGTLSGSSEAFASVSQATRIYINQSFSASFGADVYNPATGPSSSFGCSIGVSGRALAN